MTLPTGSRRGWRRVVVLVLAAGLAATGAWVLRAPAALPEDLVAVDATGVATPLGVVSRVPAISDGGADYSTTQLTLDKATAKAAAFTAGDLAESFLEISDRPLDGPLPDPTGKLPDLTLDPTTPDPNDHLGKYQPSAAEYHNPVLVKAQYPASADKTVPTSAEAPGGAARAFATEAPLAHAEANGGKTTVSGVLVVGAGSSSSQSELLGNGTVVTTAIAQAKDVLIGGVVSLASATSRAITTVPAGGTGTVDLKITVTGVAVAGVPAQLTADGLRVNDQVPISPTQLAAFNTAMASLDAAHITIRAFPGVIRTSSASAAEGAGAALSIHYNFTGQGLPGSGVGDAPYNEEVVLARVRATTVGRHRAPGGLLSDNGLPSLDLGGVSTNTGGLSTPDLGLGSNSLNGPPSVVSGASLANGSTDQGLNLVRTRVASSVVRLRDFYRIIMLLAFIGAAVLFARRRTRLS